MEKVKRIGGCILFGVITIIKIPISLINGLTFAMEYGLIRLNIEAVKLINSPSFTEQCNNVLLLNSCCYDEIADDYEDMMIDE